MLDAGYTRVVDVSLGMGGRNIRVCSCSGASERSVRMARNYLRVQVETVVVASDALLFSGGLV